MNLGGQIVGVFLVLAALIGGGAAIGHASRNGEVADLVAQVEKLDAEKSAETLRANGEVATLRTLKETLRSERERRNRIGLLAQEELATRADRIAGLKLKAEQLQQRIKTEASNDENCNALRRLPVCAAIADRLWGDSTAPRPD
ncbi:MAG: hypothetical protein ACREP4_06620 [Stenotrophomonas sp.]|uniref:hypothetical protein n=1 Tax=Stenotrophomonas sp. TaxID=69392 RepID=UPI003D6C8650